jgi:hypothetical protein
MTESWTMQPGQKSGGASHGGPCSEIPGVTFYWRIHHCVLGTGAGFIAARGAGKVKLRDFRYREPLYSGSCSQQSLHSALGSPCVRHEPAGNL